MFEQQYRESLQENRRGKLGAIIQMVFLLIFFPVKILLSGVVIWFLWNTFLTENFHIIALTWPLAIGLSLIVTFVKSRTGDTGNEVCVDPGNEIAKDLVLTTAYLVIGNFVSLFM